MMKNNIFGKLLCGTLMLFAAMSFTACVDDNEDVGMPYLELDSETLPFALEGGHATFTVKTNRPWFITKDEASDWLTVEPMVGDGTAQVEILLPEATTGREATLTFNIANSYGVYLTKTMKIQQGEIKPAAVLWHENFGTPSQTSNAWPTVANYTGWEKGGLYGADVTYSAASDKAQIRGTSPNSVGYADASGAGKLFIGTGMPAFVVGNIQTDGATNYTLNFGGAYFNYAAKDETFYSDKCHIYVSGDNAKWSELTYTVAEAEEGWVYATALFTLKEAADKLYIKLAVDEASCFSIDDMQLASGGAGGQEIDLANGTEGEGGNEGEEPTPGGDGTSDKTFPGAGKYLLLAKKEGAFVAATPSDKTSSYFYPAATAVTPANNALAADDTTNALAWTITAASTEGQYTIAMPNNHYCYGTADHTSFNISSSVGTGGYTWTFTPHTDGSWKLLCVDYSKTLQYSAQYNSFGVYKEDADSYIYLYQLNAGGTAYELVGENAGGGEGEEPTPDTPTTPTDAIWYETFGDPVQSGTKWPYTHENTANIMSGTGVVSGVTAYASYGTTARSTSSQYSPLSGVGHVWFPANKAIADNYFMVQKLALNGQTNLDLSFTLYGNGVVYKDGDIVLEMSADGSAWTKVNFTTGAISGSDWKMGTASVTLKNAGEHFYVRFSSATTGGVRMDDVTLVAGNGGTEVDLSGSGSTTPEEPTPDTPTGTALSVKELVQMMISQTAYTEKTVEGYVAAFAPTGADNMSQGTLILTDNDGAEYSGLTIYNYALSSLSLKVGDKVKIALTSGTTDNYNGLRQIKNIPADAVTVLSSGATIQYKTLTGAQLVADYEKYLSVPVQVLQAKPTAESVGKNFNTTLTFNDGTNFTVYGRSKWTAGSELTVADKTGTIRGILSTYNNPQLVPASTADVAAFTGTTTPDEGGDEPDPTPEPEPEPDPTPDPSGDVYFWKDDFSQFNSETGDSSTDLGANLKGSVDGFTESYQSVAKIYAAAAGTVKGGSSSVKGTLTTPAMKNVSGTAEATLSVDLAAWVGSAGADATKMVIKVNNGGTIDGAASVTTEQLTAEMKTYTFNLAGITSATTITIEASAASKKRFYLDNLIIKQK